MVTPEIGNVINYLIVVFNFCLRVVCRWSNVHTKIAQVDVRKCSVKTREAKLCGHRSRNVRAPVSKAGFINQPRSKRVQQRVREQPGLERRRLIEDWQTCKNDSYIVCRVPAAMVLRF